MKFGQVPTKCATGKNTKRNEWCNRCYYEYAKDPDEDTPTKRCLTCGVVHLRKYCFEKLEGWLCLDCAKEYDQALLAKMTQPQVSA